MKLLAAAAMLATGMAANAAESVVGLGLAPGFYQSNYSLTLTGPGSVGGDVDIIGATLGVSVSLIQGTSVLFDSDASDTFSFSGLSAGSYLLSFNAYGTGVGAFGGSYTVTPVPEPETYAMMLAGLGVMGFMAARRRQG